jgi:hypothetical protein
MAVARKGIEVVEQNDGDAANSGGVYLREIGKGVGRQRLRLEWSKQRSRLGGFRGEDADGLRLTAVKDGKIVFREIGHGAVFIAHDNANLN